jgi:hypothetical protein
MCGWPGNIRQEQYDRDLAPISITFFTQRLVVEGGGAIPTEVPGSASTSTGTPPERCRRERWNVPTFAVPTGRSPTGDHPFPADRRQGL